MAFILWQAASFEVAVVPGVGGQPWGSWVRARSGSSAPARTGADGDLAVVLVGQPTEDADVLDVGHRPAAVEHAWRPPTRLMIPASSPMSLVRTFCARRSLCSLSLARARAGDDRERQRSGHDQRPPRPATMTASESPQQPPKADAAEQDRRRRRLEEVPGHRRPAVQRERDLHDQPDHDGAGQRQHQFLVLTCPAVGRRGSRRRRCRRSRRQR